MSNSTPPHLSLISPLSPLSHHCRGYHLFLSSCQSMAEAPASSLRWSISGSSSRTTIRVCFRGWEQSCISKRQHARCLLSSDLLSLSLGFGSRACSGSASASGGTWGAPSPQTSSLSLSPGLGFGSRGSSLSLSLWLGFESGVHDNCASMSGSVQGAPSLSLSLYLSIYLSIYLSRHDDGSPSGGGWHDDKGGKPSI
jgi:hypothetical protein